MHVLPTLRKLYACMFNEDQSQKALGRNIHVFLCENNVKQLEEKQTAMHMKHLIKYIHSHTHQRCILLPDIQ